MSVDANPEGPARERSRRSFSSDPITTTWELLTEPSRFYRTRLTEGSLFGALVYAYGVMLVGFVGLLLVNLLMQAGAMLLLGSAEDASQVLMIALAGVVVFPFLLLFLVPLVVVMNGVLYHLATLILGVASESWTGTLRLVAYAQAPMLLFVVPFVGPLVGMVWTLVLIAIGVRQVHGTTPGRAILTLVLGWFLAVLFVLVVGVISVPLILML